MLCNVYSLQYSIKLYTTSYKWQYIPKYISTSYGTLPYMLCIAYSTVLGYTQQAIHANVYPNALVLCLMLCLAYSTAFSYTQQAINDKVGL